MYRGVFKALGCRRLAETPGGGDSETRTWSVGKGRGCELTPLSQGLPQMFFGLCPLLRLVLSSPSLHPWGAGGGGGGVVSTMQGSQVLRMGGRRRRPRCGAAAAHQPDQRTRLLPGRFLLLALRLRSGRWRHGRSASAPKDSPRRGWKIVLAIERVRHLNTSGARARLLQGCTAPAPPSDWR
jgi:hypothetical protein